MSSRESVHFAPLPTVQSRKAAFEETLLTFAPPALSLMTQTDVPQDHYVSRCFLQSFRQYPQDKKIQEISDDDLRILQE